MLPDSKSAELRHGRILWGVLVGSVVSVVSLRWFSGDGVTWQDLLAVGLAVSAVAGYGLYAYPLTKRAELPVTADQAGDNAYYIGLVLTFASLGTALVKVVVTLDAGPSAAVAAGQAKRIADLIPDFGVALASTVAGIMARLALQQQRQSPTEATEGARRDLNVAVREFARQLRVATGEISQATHAVRLGIAKQLEDATKKQVATFDEAEQSVRAAANSMAERMGGLSDRLADLSSKLAQDVEAIGDANFGGTVTELTASVGRVQVRIDTIGDASAGVSANIADVVEKLTLLAERLKTLVPEEGALRLEALAAEAAERMQRTAEHVEQTERRVGRTNEMVDETLATVTEAQRGVVRAAEGALGLADALASARLEIEGDGERKGVAKRVREDADSFRGMMSVAQRVVVTSGEEIDRRAASIADDSEALRRALRETTMATTNLTGLVESKPLGQKVHELSKAVDRLGNDVQKAAEAGEGIGDRLEAISERVQSSQGANESLASKIDDAVERAEAVTGLLEESQSVARQLVDDPPARFPRLWRPGGRR